MYYHEVSENFNAGEPIRRAGWNKKSKLVKAAAVEAEVSIGEEERKSLKLGKTAEVTPSEDFLILVENEKSAIAGYKLTKQDELAQDWEFAK